ncbi:MAG: phospho-sugar mutase [Acidimicrobiia bacterium]|nr:phospho-sugar mutase [Acidimicrobiia bacterium]
MTDVLEQAKAWIEGDPDPSTRLELEALVAARDMGELTERMNGALAFGTAGLRGRVEAGSNRMNRAVVIRTTRGLADYLLRRYDGVPTRPVVIGRDARLSSPQFMADTSGVLTAAGIEVRYWEGDTPTPVVAYAGRVLDAVAAIVITASHNPPYDNGYKVYDANGAQIIPPVDHEIAAAVDRVGPAAGVPRIEGETPLAQPIERELLQAYLDDVDNVRSSRSGVTSLRIVYTPMHGVGWETVHAALRRAGYEDLHPVPEQVEPDGTFPTVAFPNPEEPGALDLALALAEARAADVVLANDPDADRLAVAVPTAAGWRQLTGNQVGQLLAEHVLGHYHGVDRPIVINSIVSSPMLAAIADRHGARFETTLTGFKWIANAAMDLEASRVGTFVFGYEEALGYTVGPIVRDKDGVSAAVVFADLMAGAKAARRSAEELLEDLADRYGLWVSTQLSVVRLGSSGTAEIDQAMDSLATAIPRQLAGREVVKHVDYRSGQESRPRWLPNAALVALDLDDESRVLVRPSGTEPKLKIYVDVRADRDASMSLFDQDSGLVAEADNIAAALARYLGLG